MTACNSPASSAADDADVPVVVNAWPPPAQWAVDPVPLAVIGAPGDAQQIGEVAGMLILRDGTLLIADAVLRSVRLFDSTGAFIRVVVREGDGPEETRGVDALFSTSHDTIYVYDKDHGTMLLLNSAAVPVRKISELYFDADSGSFRYSTPNVVGVLDDGSLVTEASPAYFLAPGEDIGSAGELPKHARDWMNSGRVYRRGMPGGPLLAELLVQKPAASGAAKWASSSSGLLAAFGNGIVVAASDTFGFSLYSNMGRLLGKSVVQRPRMKVVFPASVTPDSTEMTVAVDDILQFGHDAAGHIWTLSPMAVDGFNLTVAYLVFEASGRLIAQVPVELNFGIRAVRGDLLLGVVTNDQEEQQVQLRRLRRR